MPEAERLTRGHQTEIKTGRTLSLKQDWIKEVRHPPISSHGRMESSEDSRVLQTAILKNLRVLGRPAHIIMEATLALRSKHHPEILEHSIVAHSAQELT